jgi:hypothetical protein
MIPEAFIVISAKEYQLVINITGAVCLLVNNPFPTPGYGDCPQKVKNKFVLLNSVQ